MPIPLCTVFRTQTKSKE